jgi:uncharacterized membrane protein YeaQ/YmgE (transglycosylase-associated protein family)
VSAYAHDGPIQLGGLLGSIIGAVLLLLVARAVRGDRRRTRI